MKLKLLFVLFISIILASCVSKHVQKGTKTGASKYNPASSVLHPQFKVFHETDDYSKLYFKLYTKELRFSSANEQRINQTVIKLSYKITSSIRDNNILDSAKTILKIKKQVGQTSIISFFKIKNIELKQYLIEINLYDVYGNKKSQSYIRVNKSDDGNEQYYITLKGKNNKPVFTEYFKPNDTLYIKNKNNSLKTMQIVHYHSNFRIPKNPYNTGKQEPIRLKKVTSWYLPVDNKKATFHTKEPGIYIIRADTTKIRGLMKVQFSGAYPLISKSNELVEALAYLLNNNEFLKMQNSKNKKLSIDNFWLKTAGNKEKAKELIRIWYNRATYSNYYFSSYKEGIKTDRGMIYTVFGPADDIIYFDDAEKWIYTNTKTVSKLEFIFVKQLNSISNNDYTLIRKSKYESVWNKAINTWRLGKVFRY